MLRAGICRPSDSAWSSPLLLVGKKDGSFRPCGYYRRSNTITKPDRYPLPHIHDFTSNLYVLKRFQKFGVAINANKCIFGAQQLIFLGHIVNSPLPKRISEIQNWSLPPSKKGLQRFLGSINYYHRFIPNAAQLQDPLFELAASIKKKDGKLIWTPETRDAFVKSPDALANSLHLSHPKPNAKLRLCTDASSTAIGAVLEQARYGSWEPLGFFSRKLTPTQAR
ncbi:hypothetical protein QTP88_014848 [Uroleucon formosanum]